MALFVTGGAGFIGSNFIAACLAARDEPVVNLDALTYAGNPENLAEFEGDPRYHFVEGSITDAGLVAEIFARHEIRAVVHFAAESHVDRSIDAPAAFIDTNVGGTFCLLEAARAYWEAKGGGEFRFVHISTDEVYGALAPDDAPFTEAHPYCPNSPYSASKAASDHLVHAYHHTYGLPALITHCSNNYGPRQLREKLIPCIIGNALRGDAIPVYGDGQQIRDWLYVEDHCAALLRVLEAGEIGRVYNIGGACEKTNLEVVETICGLLDKKRPRPDGTSYAELVAHVEDRLGHDRRYAVDVSRMRDELGWTACESFASGIVKTLDWYLAREEAAAPRPEEKVV